MSLLNQLIAAVFAVLIGLVSGTMYIVFDSSKSILLSQLETNSQNTATNLGLYLAPAIAEQDAATIEVTVNAIFDSGFYRSIAVNDGEGQEIFSSQKPPEIAEGVPLWFIDMVEIEPPQMVSPVTFNWRRAGEVVVTGRAGYAYEELWKAAQDAIIWFVSLSLICVFALSTLIRFILRPLLGIERQANAVADKKYIEQDRIPGTRELKSVVLAMNRMIRQVRTMFDEQSKNIEALRATAFKDNLTGLANQRSTQAQLTDWLDYKKEEGPAALLYLHLDDLGGLNEKLGEDEANNFIKSTSSQLAQLAERYQPNVVGRISGADFVALIPRPDSDTLSREMGSLAEDIAKHCSAFPAVGDKPIQLAAIDCDGEISSAQLLSEARLAIKQGLSEQTACVFATASEQGQSPMDLSSDWQNHVAQSINNQQVFLQYQPVVSLTDDSVTHRELLARILDQDGQPCTAMAFIRVVKELGLIEALDRAVIGQAINYLVAHPEAEPLAINLSQKTIHADGFDSWLSQSLAGKSLSGRLNIEINETAVLVDVDRVVAFRDQLKPHSIGFGVDNFGVHPSGFSYLYSVQPDYVKIDGSLTHEIDSNAEDRFFMGSLITVARSLGVAAYAERVERDSQISELKQMGLDGSQGFFHGKPEALS